MATNVRHGSECHVALLAMAMLCYTSATAALDDPSVARWYQDLSIQINADERSAWQASMDHIREGDQLYSDRLRHEGSERHQRFRREAARDSGYKHAVDWRSSGLLLSPSDQGTCGSCWAFSSTHAVVDRLRLANRRRPAAVTASVQHVLECACRRAPSLCGAADGCRGARQYLGQKFYKAYGSPPEQCKAYRGPSRSCRRDCDDGTSVSSQPMTTIRSYQFVVRHDMRRAPLAVRAQAIRSALARGPLVARMRVYSDLSVHRSGIYSPTSRARARGFHSVEMVGYGKTASAAGSVAYWIVKNSWGTRFGRNGYFYVKVGSRASMEAEVIEPQVTTLKRSLLRQRHPFLSYFARRGMDSPVPGDDPNGPMNCERVAIKAWEKSLPEYQHVLTYLDSVVVDRHDVLPGCYENGRRFSRVLLNGTHQLVDSYVYVLTVKYTRRQCPGLYRIVRGEVSLGFDTGRYSLLRSRVEAASPGRCVCASGKRLTRTIPQPN